MCSDFRHIFLFGNPGVGKTTLINKIYQKLCAENVREKYPNLHINGFTTSEIRSPSDGQRTGFKVETVDGKNHVVFASESIQNFSGFSLSKNHYPKVGKYFVDVENFQRLAVDRALKNLDEKKSLIIIDEIGKMECFSRSFCDQVRKLIDSKNTIILGMLPIDKPNLPPLINFVRNRSDVKLIGITRQNRNDIDDEILRLLMNILEYVYSEKGYPSNT